MKTFVVTAARTSHLEAAEVLQRKLEKVLKEMPTTSTIRSVTQSQTDGPQGLILTVVIIYS